jgi:hypothetical protein
MHIHTAESDAVTKKPADAIVTMLVETTEELVINEPIPNEPAIVNLPTETKEISNKPVVDEVIISNSEPMIATEPMV